MSLSAGKKRVVLGTPVTNREEFNRLKNVSFCVSFYNRLKLGPQLEDCMRIVNASTDQILLIDNGAFSAHMAGIELDDAYWEQFSIWAGWIMDRCPAAIAVIPDVIGGSEAQNDDLSDWFFSMCENKGVRIDPDRTMAVWHLHESTNRLWDLAGQHRYIAFGSSGDYLDSASSLWQERIWEAFQTIDKRCYDFDEPRPWVHMMKFQSELKNFPFDSADSTNFASNAHRFKRYGPGYLSLVADRLKMKHIGTLDTSHLPDRKGVLNPKDLSQYRRFDLLMTDPLSDEMRLHGPESDHEFWQYFFHMAWADLLNLDYAEINSCLEDIAESTIEPTVFDLMKAVVSEYKMLQSRSDLLGGMAKEKAACLSDFLSVYAGAFDQMQPQCKTIKLPSEIGQFRIMAKEITDGVPKLQGSLGSSYKPRLRGLNDDEDSESRQLSLLL